MTPKDLITMQRFSLISVEVVTPLGNVSSAYGY